MTALAACFTTFTSTKVQILTQISKKTSCTASQCLRGKGGFVFYISAGCEIRELIDAGHLCMFVCIGGERRIGSTQVKKNFINPTNAFLLHFSASKASRYKYGNQDSVKATKGKQVVDRRVQESLRSSYTSSLRPHTLVRRLRPPTLVA